METGLPGLADVFSDVARNNSDARVNKQAHMFRNIRRRRRQDSQHLGLDLLIWEPTHVTKSLAKRGARNALTKGSSLPVKRSK